MQQQAHETQLLTHLVMRVVLLSMMTESSEVWQGWKACCPAWEEGCQRSLHQKRTHKQVCHLRPNSGNRYDALRAQLELVCGPIAIRTLCETEKCSYLGMQGVLLSTCQRCSPALQGSTALEGDCQKSLHQQ